MKPTIKLVSKRRNPTRLFCLLKSKKKNRVFNTISSRSKTNGSSMIELLLASALALFAASTAARMMNNFYNSGMNRRAAATSVIEVAISNDLAWFRQYAVLWRLQSGPFNNLSLDVTHTLAPYIQIPNANPFNLTNRYQVLPECKTTYVAPINNPPNAVPDNNSSSSIALPAVASGHNLTRIIQPGPTQGTLTITYTLSRSGTNLFERSSSIYLPAAGWCP
jgi:hypothetical protein